MRQTSEALTDMVEVQVQGVCDVDVEPWRTIFK